MLPAFFHISWGTDNSLRADLNSAPPEISLRGRSEMYQLEKLSLGFQKRVPAKTWTEEYSQGTDAGAGGSWGIVFRSGPCSEGIASMKFRFQKGKAQSLKPQKGVSYDNREI